MLALPEPDTPRPPSPEPSPISPEPLSNSPRFDQQFATQAMFEDDDGLAALHVDDHSHQEDADVDDHGHQEQQEVGDPLENLHTADELPPYDHDARQSLDQAPDGFGEEENLHRFK